MNKVLVIYYKENGQLFSKIFSRYIISKKDQMTYVREFCSGRKIKRTNVALIPKISYIVYKEIVNKSYKISDNLLMTPPIKHDFFSKDQLLDFKEFKINSSTKKLIKRIFEDNQEKEGELEYQRNSHNSPLLETNDDYDKLCYINQMREVINPSNEDKFNYLTFNQFNIKKQLKFSQMKEEPDSPTTFVPVFPVPQPSKDKISENTFQQEKLLSDGSEQRLKMLIKNGFLTEGQFFIKDGRAILFKPVGNSWGDWLSDSNNMYMFRSKPFKHYGPRWSNRLSYDDISHLITNNV